MGWNKFPFYELASRNWARALQANCCAVQYSTVQYSRNVHNSVISLDLTEDYEFTITGRFQKPLHRQVVEYLNITKAEQEGKVKINHKITWNVKRELMNRQDENWSWGQKTKLTAGQKSWGR